MVSTPFTDPLSLERRRRRVSRAPFRGTCGHCGGAMVLLTRGRDQRAVCAACGLPVSGCLCRPRRPTGTPPGGGRPVR